MAEKLTGVKAGYFTLTLFRAYGICPAAGEAGDATETVLQFPLLRKGTSI